MRIILDSHVLIWWLEDNPKLGMAARRLIDDPLNRLSVSVATPWEIAIKVGLRKLKVDLIEMMDRLTERNIKIIEVTAAHLLTLAELERLHGDPFDRMIICQSIGEGAFVMTDDAAIVRYPVRVVPCR